MSGFPEHFQSNFRAIIKMIISGAASEHFEITPLIE